MNLDKPNGKFLRTLLACALVAVAVPQTEAALTDISPTPLVTSAASSVLPNVFLMMDDSGSMSWTFMPDVANDFRGKVGYASSQCNGVYYDPSITYSPPVDSTGISYPAMSFTAAQYDGFNTASGALDTSTGKGTLNLSTSFQRDMFIPYSANSSYSSWHALEDTVQPAYYYTYSGTQTSTAQKKYLDTSSTFYTECNTTPGYTATIKINSATNPSTISSVTVGGVTITSGASSSSTTTTSTVAANLAAKITANGYSATSSGSTVTITAPLTAPPTGTPSAVVNVSSGTVSSTVTAFPVPLFKKVIVSATSGPGSTDERTNFANWFSYYRNRMNMMKTSTGMAFKPIDSRFRVGFGTMNNNGSNKFLNIDIFNAAQKSSWYGQLYGATPGNSTPLPKALSRAGQLYAHKLPSNTLNGVSANDPVQYACQQNFTILTTDGYWNDATNYNLSGSSIGNQDGTEPRPYYDGATVTYAKRTSQVTESQVQVTENTSQYQKRTQQIQSSTSTLQKQVTQLQQTTSQLQQQVSQITTSTRPLQVATGQLQKRESSNSGSSWGAWTDVSSCQWDNNGSGRRQCRYNWGSWANASATCTQSYSTDTSHNTTWSGNGTACQYGAWSAPAFVSSCTPVSASTGPTNYTVLTARSCSTGVLTAYANVASCTATTVPDGSGQTVQCRYLAGSPAGVATCAPVTASVGPNYTVQNPVACNAVVTSAFANVSPCTETTTPDSSGYTTQCQYTSWTGWANASSCTAVAQSTGPSYTAATAKQCQTTDTGWVGISSPCTNSTSGGQTITCQTATTGPTLVASCTAQTASAGNNYLRRTCSTTTLSGPTAVASCTPVTGIAPSYTSTTCNTVTTGPTNTTSCAAAAASASNAWTATTCTYVSTAGGTSDTLADVAEYYYMTDLRTSALSNNTGALGSDVASNVVPKNGLDTASWQHMTTFTLGLGASGRMVYSATYQSDTGGDYVSVKNGTAANPSGGVCSWQSSGTTCNWPTPHVSGTPENIDDLWHAAVNGRGTYFSATNPTTLTTGLSSALSGVTARTGAAAAATTSNPNVTSGDNFLFNSTFMTVQWTGELARTQLDLNTGIPSATDDWSAQTQLDTKTSRTIYTFDSTATSNRLKAFLWANLTATEQAYFSLANLTTLSQFCAVGATCLSATDQAAAAGANLVNFLRGDRTNEGVISDTSKYYHQRIHLLGDIVNAEAAYVKTPRFSYTDSGYSAFVGAKNTRTGMVYAAANDGMVHAFNSGTGDEVWAYVPALVMSTLYKLADKNYDNNHQYYVDGTPEQGDVYFQAYWETAPSWHTILVGGLNAGGRGYYALDVTDPAAPKALWELTHANMGYTFGNPLIAKLKDGTWVVIVSSGYNNVSPGDGKGYVYVLNAGTGAVIRTIGTNIGSTTTPSGLSRLAGWVNDSMTDATVQRVYGGDLQGNLWRFDVNGDTGAAGYDAQKLVALVDGSGNPQPITTRPGLTMCTGQVVALVGTGRYFGTTDLSDSQQQSFYAVKDDLGSTTYGNPRVAANGFIHQVQTATTCPAGAPTSICSTGENVRTSTSSSVDMTTDSGWYVDFVDSGERLNTDPAVVLGSVAFNTNVPNSSACVVGGYSYRNLLNSCTGGASSSAMGVTTVRLASAMATRPTVVMLPNGTFVALTRVTGNDSSCANGTCSDVLTPDSTGGGTRRVSWRELPTDQ